MPKILFSLALLLALLLVPGKSAEAAGGISVNLRVHAHNIPQAVAAGRSFNAGGGAGTSSLSRSISTTRSIQFDASGEGGAIKSPR